MTSHTKGPWEVDEDGLAVRALNGQMKVADIRGWGYLTGKGTLGLDHDEATRIQFANGYVMAAAPDMLEALMRIAHEIPPNGEDFVHFVDRIARAAIAKAEGKKP